MSQATPVMLVDQFGNYVAAGGGGGGGTSNVNLFQVGGAAYGLGPNVAANSQSVVMATDSVMNISGSVTASGTMTLGAGTAIAGKFGIDQTTPGTTNAVQLVSGTAGGNNKTMVIISSTTATVIKATAGQVYALSMDNNGAGAVYAKFYDAASATVGVGTPAMLYMIPGPTNGGGGFRDIAFPNGVAMTTGICLIVTVNQANNDTIAVPASTVTVNVFWK